MIAMGGPAAEKEFVSVVRDKTVVADGVVTLELGRPDGSPLPPWRPGAHVDLILDRGLVRQYSLCGDPADLSAYRVGVLREPAGRGGSAYVHDTLAVGDRVLTRGPRNHFALDDAPSYLFVAGGIGITPLLPMIVEADTRNSRWSLLYGGRTRRSMAFLDVLERYGDRVLVHPQDTSGLLDLRGFVAGCTNGTLVYGCGPEPMLAALEDACGVRAREILRVERFSPKEEVHTGGDGAFDVVLARSGLTVKVGPGQTVLERVEAAGVNVLSSCQEGTCGTCETDVLEGTPDHRDSLLTEDERAEGTTMMICVSRCLGERLVLDL
ncbi:ferredoxin [Planotetraspora thailandica]|uniref:Ferredoxin n=1 Tax=Planotetraspora thailandica TaxID=487172 RepID=A0A8J4DE35_9ACTN|nr:PDR/VanB family oxidoreductase [Planotetraspora thailandica]GII58696.1 ferredoxin [Planotetraspora thailandica]